VDESFGPASVVLRGYGRRVGAGIWSDLLSGLTPYLGCLETGSSPGSRSFRHPPALPLRSAWPGQEAGVSQIGGQRVRAIPQPQRKGTALAILEDTRVITGGVDTHADMQVAAALDPVGGLLGVQEFPAAAAGYADLLGWLPGFGDLALVGVEGTGSYGAGLARYLAGAGIGVVEVDRADRQDRHRHGKSDPLDAVSAARAAQSGRATGEPKGRDGAVEAIRALMVAKRSARAERTQAIGQARALIVTGPNDLRARFAGLTAAALAEAIAALRPRPGDAARYAVRIALRELGRRVEFPGGQLERLDDLIIPLVTARAPGLLSLYGVGPGTAALLLVAAGDHPGRLRSEAAWAHLCGADPRLVGEGAAAPPQSRREPRGQPRPVADRDHPDELAPANPRLRRPAHQGRPD
jgi:transposase